MESDEELPFARIGSVVETATAEDAAVPFVFPSGNGMVWRERPEAVVLASAEDADAPLFATRLADTGAAVSLFRAEDAGPLSRAVLTASAVFVLSGASLPDDPQVAFALQVLTRDGGIILSLGESDGLPETVPHRHFPNGISL